MTNEAAQADTTMFFAHYGAAMSAWAKVEMQILLLMVVVLSTDQAFASEIFGHIKSAESRVTLLHRLISVSQVSDSAKAEWRTTLKGLREAITHRNRLAHYQTTRTTHSDGTVEPPKLEPHFELGQIKRTNVETYDIERLRTLHVQFGALERALEKLAMSIIEGRRTK